MRFKAGNTFTNRSKGVPKTGNQGQDRLFATAAVLARKGRYAEATKLLERARDANECSDAEALDLQARIYVQQGLYLSAESCWRKAKTVDGANPTYDEALDRLRRMPPSTDRLSQAIVSLGVLVVFGLFVWQVAVVNPGIRSRQHVAESLLTTLRSDFAAFQSVSQSQGQTLAVNLAGVRSTLRQLETQLVGQLNAMPTAARMEENSNAIITRLDAAVAQERQVVAAMESTLSQRVETVESGVSRRVDAIETSLSREIQSRATSAEVAQLGQAITTLAAFQSVSQSEGETLAANLAEVVSTLRELETRLVEHFRGLPTVSRFTEDRNALMERIDETVAQVSTFVAAMESTLSQRVETVESGVSRRVDAIETSLSREIQSRTTSAEVAQLGQAITTLQEQLTQLAVTVQELTKAVGARATDAGAQDKGT